MTESIKNVLDSLNGGQIVDVETVRGRFTGIYRRQNEKYVLFLATDGADVTVDKEALLKMEVKKIEDMNELEHVCISYFAELLSSGLDEKYPEIRDNGLDREIYSNWIRFSSEKVSLSISNGKCKLISGISMRVGRMGELEIVTNGIGFRYGDFQGVLDNIKMEMLHGNEETLTNESDLARIARLEEEIEAYKEALRHALKG